MAIGKLPDIDLEGTEDAIFAEINITPLTDIFLVLLIIFMVSSSVAVKEAVEQAKTDASSGLKINLPSGAAQEIDPGRNSLVIAIQQTGQIVVNGQPVSEDDLDRLFLSAFTIDKDTQIVLKADSGVNHGRVVGVMERAKRVGLSRLAIATRGGGG